MPTSIALPETANLAVRKYRNGFQIVMKNAIGGDNVVVTREVKPGEVFDFSQPPITTIAKAEKLLALWDKCIVDSAQYKARKARQS